MPDREHVPETRNVEAKPNREQRRHPEQVDPTEVARVRDVQEDLLKRGPDDDAGVRAKSSGHRKKTADKWNQ
jgi:hypothetical protein